MTTSPPVFACMVPTPDEPVPTWNRIMRAHWSLEHRWVERFKEEILWRMNALSPATKAKFPLQKAMLRVTIYYCGNISDTTNTWAGVKIAEDALVQCKVLAEDNPNVLESAMPVQVRVPHRNERKVLMEVWKVEDMTHAQT